MVLLRTIWRNALTVLDNATTVKKMVSWILNQGQNLNNTLEYTRVPENIAAKIMEKVENQITSK